MSEEMTAGQDEVVPRPRRRGVQEGRIVTNVPACLGEYIAEEASDLGISPSTYARMMLVECVKGRGMTMKDLEAKYPAKKQAVDKRFKTRNPDGSVAGMAADNASEAAVTA